MVCTGSAQTAPRTIASGTDAVLWAKTRWIKHPSQGKEWIIHLLYIENALIELLNDEQKNKFFTLKEALNVKKVYKLVDGEHEKIDLITGLNSGGYTEIIKGEINEGDEVISKIIVETSNKKALRLF